MKRYINDIGCINFLRQRAMPGLFGNNSYFGYGNLLLQLILLRVTFNNKCRSDSWTFSVMNA